MKQYKDNPTKLTKLTRANVDAVILVCASILFTFISIHFDTFESIVHFVKEYEQYEIDEILTMIIIMSIGLCTFALRRLTDLKDEIQHREIIQIQLQHMSLHDALTSLPNRRHFDQQLTNFFTQFKVTNGFLAIIMIDLNRFKHINDSYGHHYGDEVLKTVATRLRNTLAHQYFVSRLGGDEFAVLAYSSYADTTHRDNIETLCDKIILAIDQPIKVEGIELFAGVSLGVTIADEQNSSTNELMQQADSAMYFAKLNQSTHVSIYNLEMDQQRQIDRQIEMTLKTALVQQQFFVRYQPQFDHMNKLIGFEALIFWAHPELGELSANQFLTIAENSGQINLIDHWCLERACYDASMWPENVKLCLNISPFSFQRVAFITELDNIITATKFNSSRLSVEITEQLLIQQIKSNEDYITLLKQRGIHTVLDNFGTGYSSLTHLQRFDIDRIKINRRIVETLQDKQQQAMLIKAIIDLATSLKMDVMVNGIETQAQYQDWYDIGCHYFQGQFLSPSLSQSEVLAFCTQIQIQQNNF